MKWKFFVGAVILTWALLFKLGAPIVPVIAGTLVVGVLNWRRMRRA